MLRNRRGESKGVLRLLTNKKGEFGLISLLALLFGSILIASAAVLNSTENLSTDTLDYTILNDTSIDLLNSNKSIIENISNISVIENATLNESVNLTISEEFNSLNQTNNIISNDTIINETVLNLTLLNITNQSINITLNEIIINQTILNLSNGISNGTFDLAEVFNEDGLDFDRKLKNKYLRENNNFSHIKFKKISNKENFKLKAGAKQDKIRGISVNNKNFAVDLLYCEQSGRYCAFRINGVPAAKLHSFKEFGESKENSFDMDGDYALKVNSIEFDRCDNKRFCHFGYEGYNIVNVSVERKWKK